MKYTLQSSKYILKNFIYIFPLALVPAIFFSLSTDGEAVHEVLQMFFDGEMVHWHFACLFRSISMLSFLSWKSIGFGIAGIIAIIIFGSWIIALLEKHMRIGKRTYNGIFSKINDNLMPVFQYTVAILLIYEIWALLTTSILFVVSRIPIVALAYLCIVSAFVGMHFVLLYAVGLIYLWLPCMQITGFKAGEALSYSNKISAPVQIKIMFGQTLSLLLVEFLVCLCIWLLKSNEFMVISTILYAIIIMSFCVRMEIAYFDLDHIQRADLKKYYH